MLSYTTRKWLFIIAVFSIICMAMLFILQLTISNTSYETVKIIPFQARIEWLNISIVVLYTFALISTATKYIHWYFIPLVVFITVQLVYYTWLLLDRDSYIQEQLELSWNNAFNNDNVVLSSIQEHWQCQGFNSVLDRPGFIDDTMVQSCFQVLAKEFGTTIFVLGIGLWVIKLIQAIGLLACYILYMHIKETDNLNNTLIQQVDSLPSNDTDDSTCEKINTIKEQSLH